MRRHGYSPSPPLRPGRDHQKEAQRGLTGKLAGAPGLEGFVMSVRVRLPVTVVLAFKARATVRGIRALVAGTRYIAFALLALVLTACGGGPAATSPTTVLPSGTGASAQIIPKASSACVRIGNTPGDNCGYPADPASLPMSNGHNTNVANDCWADPSCPQVLTAWGPGDWTVFPVEPAGNKSVRTGPEVGQLTGDWCPVKGTWAPLVGGCPGGAENVPLTALSSLSSSYAESFPHNPQTIAEAAYDIWLPGDTALGYSHEVMVWVDNVNRGFGGATELAADVQVAGQRWDLWQYQHTLGTGGEIVWSLDGPQAGRPAQQASGTVDLLALLRWLQANGHLPATAAVAQVDFTFEVCSTGGRAERFTVTSFTLAGH